MLYLFKKSSIRHNIKKFIFEFKKNRMRFKMALLDVETSDTNDHIKLSILISGIKNQIVSFTPEEIVFNDNLLMEFSPCDVRSITYLSFQSHIHFSREEPIIILKQKIINGKTFYTFLNKITKKEFSKSASEAYQDYLLLNEISRKDMLNIISTAVQEQAIQDMKNMSAR